MTQKQDLVPQAGGIRTDQKKSVKQISKKIKQQSSWEKRINSWPLAVLPASLRVIRTEEDKAERASQQPGRMERCTFSPCLGAAFSPSQGLPGNMQAVHRREERQSCAHWLKASDITTMSISGEVLRRKKELEQDELQGNLPAAEMPH